MATHIRTIPTYHYQPCAMPAKRHGLAGIHMMPNKIHNALPKKNAMKHIGGMRSIKPEIPAAVNFQKALTDMSYITVT